MKMQPIVFINQYSNKGFGGDDQEGFEPYRKDSGDYVRAIRCELECSCWYNRPLLTLKVMEVLADGQACCIHEVCVWGGHQTLRALCNGEIRGNYAENVAQQLFMDLFVLNPAAQMKKFLIGH